MSSPPSTLGQYQIIREIARSNDIVYEAYDPLMNRRVAIKELMMPSGSTPQQKEDRTSRFKREAQAAGTLNHPNIMTVYSFAEDAGHTFMAMEFLDGQTLRNELDARGALPLDRAVEIAKAVLSGLEHAHSKGVIHRDIKPDNVQILTNGQIKITDFGIARLTFQPNLTVDGQVFGTPSYMSPEQVVGRDIDARSDIFSVGVMLYEMLLGQKPFTGDSVVSTTYAIMNKELDAPPPNIPWPLWSVIERAVEKSPAMRWTSAAEMKGALEEAMDPSSGVLPMVDPSVPSGYLPSTNPYAPPAQPSNPSISYNPYGPAAPGANPYAGQYGQTQQPQPLTYPYNPYQSGGFVPPPVGMPPPMGIPPGFYPPPPRQPLVKPEQIQFLKKVVLAILIIGALFGLIFVGIQALFNEMSQIDTRTAKLETRQKALEDEAQAQKDLQNNDLPQAENHLDDALKKDPNNADAYAQKGQLLYNQATTVGLSAPEAATLFQQSAVDFDKACTNATDKSKQQNYAYQFALASDGFAKIVVSTPVGDLPPDSYREARIDVERAAPMVQTEDPDLYGQMQTLLAVLRTHS